MTDADTDEMLTVVSDAVTVEKSFEPDDFPVPAIAFTVRSDRDADVSVRLADTVPDDVAPENIGFHPKYGAEFWDVENGRIVFQRDLSPGEEYTTVYGLRGGNADTAAKFMSEPTIESVEPPLSDDGEQIDSALEAAVVDGSTTEGPSTETIEVGSSDPDTGGLGDGTEDETEAGAESEAPRANDSEAERSLSSAVASETSLSDDPSTEDDGSPSVQEGDGSLVEALADEIRDGSADDDDLMKLRDALGLDLATASVEARIEHLQSSVADLEAYTDSLEAFLDEEGDAQTLISDTKARYEAIDERVGELEGQVSELRSDLDDRPADVETVVDERIDSELEEVRSDLGELVERLDDEGKAREEIRADLEDLSSELADVAEMRDRLTSALGGLAGGASPDEDDGTGSEPGDADPDGADERERPDVDAGSGADDHKDDTEIEAEVDDEEDAEVDDADAADRN